MTNQASNSPEKQLSSQCKETGNCALHKMLVRPLLTYGSESWSVEGEDKNMLRIPERRTLRIIYDPVKKMVYGNQGITMNFMLYNEPDIMEVIEVWWLRWL
jgi:hypothetical protein